MLFKYYSLISKLNLIPHEWCILYFVYLNLTNVTDISLVWLAVVFRFAKDLQVIFLSFSGGLGRNEGYRNRS